MTVTYLTTGQLETGLDEIRQSPGDQGVLELIVRRPGVDRREVLDTAELSLADGLIEVSESPHTGCGKFVSRFGLDAMRFVNSRLGRELSLRGVNAKVVRAGAVRVGDAVTKTPA